MEQQIFWKICLCRGATPLFPATIWFKSSPTNSSTPLQNSIDEIAKLLNGQKHLEGRYEELVMNDKNSSEMSSLKQNMKSSAQAIMKSVKLNPLATENLIKLQQDRFVVGSEGCFWKTSLCFI